MKICVTGGLGFIGSHIVDRLVNEGHDVFVVDNLSTGDKENQNPAAEVHLLDIGDAPFLERLFLRKKPDAVCHLAAHASVASSMDNPEFDAEINFMGTLGLLRIARNCGCHRFLFTSSAAVYGDSDSLPVDEEHPTNPESFYGLSKCTAEHYIRLFCRHRGMSYAIFRPANVYGPRQSSSGEAGVVAQFASNMDQEKPCAIDGDGSQTRDYVYVKDVAAAFSSALTAKENLTVNISTEVETSIKHLFLLMSEIRGYTLPPVQRLPRQGDIQRSCLTNRRAKKLLGWTPRYTLKEGLAGMFSSRSMH